MDDQVNTTCLHCGRDEQLVPLIAWRYQGRSFVICSDCLPNLIHRRETILNTLEKTAPRRAERRAEGDNAER